jgi:hypothetical protein
MKTLPGMAYCLEKYWPNQEVHILGYTEHPYNLPDNFIFHSLGVDPGPEKFSNAIREFMATNSPEYFIFTTDDVFPIRPVDQELINQLAEKYCNKELGRVGLWNDIQKRPCTITCILDKTTIVTATKHALYRVSLPWSIWRREALLEVFIDNLSPWKTEGRPLASKVIGTRGHYAIHPSHGMYSANIPHTWDKCICCGERIEPGSYNELKELVAWKKEL